MKEILCTGWWYRSHPFSHPQPQTIDGHMDGYPLLVLSSRPDGHFEILQRLLAHPITSGLAHLKFRKITMLDTEIYPKSKLLPPECRWALPWTERHRRKSVPDHCDLENEPKNRMPKWVFVFVKVCIRIILVWRKCFTECSGHSSVLEAVGFGVWLIYFERTHIYERFYLALLQILATFQKI